MLKLNKITKEARKRKGKWNVDLEFVLTFYDAHLREASLAKVAKTFEMTQGKMWSLVQQYPELQQAKRMAEENRRRGYLGKWVLENLSPEARRTWDRINGMDRQDEIEAIFHGKTPVLRQKLFCHALLAFGFNVSAACAKVGISNKDLGNWKHDPEFLEMLEDVQFHKKNFFENALLDLVEERYAPAVLMVNRTANADRGYGERLEVNGSMETKQVGPDTVDWDKVFERLDVDTQKKLLKAVEEVKAGAAKQLPAKR
jgi:hypothetical protein